MSTDVKLPPIVEHVRTSRRGTMDAQNNPTFVSYMQEQQHCRICYAAMQVRHDAKAIERVRCPSCRKNITALHKLLRSAGGREYTENYLVLTSPSIDELGIRASEQRMLDEQQEGTLDDAYAYGNNQQPQSNPNPTTYTPSSWAGYDPGHLYAGTTHTWYTAGSLKSDSKDPVNEAASFYNTTTISLAEKSMGVQNIIVLGRPFRCLTCGSHKFVRLADIDNAADRFACFNCRDEYDCQK